MIAGVRRLLYLPVLGLGLLLLINWTPRPTVRVHAAVTRDVSAPLQQAAGFHQRTGAYAPPEGVVHAMVESAAVAAAAGPGPGSGPGAGLGTAPPAPRRRFMRPRLTGAALRAFRLAHAATAPPPPPKLPPAFPEIGEAGRSVEQRALGTRPAPEIVASFDGLGYGFQGLTPPLPPPPGAPELSPSAVARARHGFGAMDLSLAVGPTQVVQIINSRMAVFNKQGKLLYGDVPTNTIFEGFAGRCATSNNGDAVVRYDQLAHRWLFVMPIFSRPQGQPRGPYGMCYAVSTSANALGTYYRYEFDRPNFPDYPRPAVWPNGYYVPTSSGDGMIQKQDCIADRARMLKGEPATEQCVVIDGASFLNNADVDGPTPPPAGEPNLLMANGGTQLKGIYDGEVLYWYQVHVNWKNPSKTYVSRGHQIAVAPYHFLCNGQLSNCVPQLNSHSYLDSQGDKLMQRLVYRNWDGHQSVLAEDSVDTSADTGGVRWYEFRLNGQGEPVLYQQGTYAPDGHYRWMASMDMDKFGDIGVGYSYGGADVYPGQRFAARRAGDPLGQLTTQEAVLAVGQGAQSHNRWEDYTTTAMDPSDDCTFWYVGDYLKAGAPGSTTRIGAFRLPNCRN
ncbi:MAG: hypothetical protein ACRD1Y_15055 [Terriglobales bacterium]